MRQREIVRIDELGTQVITHHKETSLFQVEVDVGIDKRVIADFHFVLYLELLCLSTPPWEMEGT